MHPTSKVRVCNNCSEFRRIGSVVEMDCHCFRVQYPPFHVYVSSFLNRIDLVTRFYSQFDLSGQQLGENQVRLRVSNDKVSAAFFSFFQFKISRVSFSYLMIFSFFILLMILLTVFGRMPAQFPISSGMIV